jgi:hypothetical protein
MIDNHLAANRIGQALEKVAEAIRYHADQQAEGQIRAAKIQANAASRIAGQTQQYREEG